MSSLFFNNTGLRDPSPWAQKPAHVIESSAISIEQELLLKVGTTTFPEKIRLPLRRLTSMQAERTRNIAMKHENDEQPFVYWLESNAPQS